MATQADNAGGDGLRSPPHHLPVADAVDRNRRQITGSVSRTRVGQRDDTRRTRIGPEAMECYLNIRAVSIMQA